MRKASWLLPILLLVSGISFGDVDTKDGAAIVTSSNMDGFTSNVGKADGQTIKSAAACGSQTERITETGGTNETSNFYGDKEAGQSWKIPAGGNGKDLYSISIEVSDQAGSASEFELRVDDDTDMSSEYLAKVTISNPTGTGFFEFVLDSGDRFSLNSATTYYFIWQNNDADYGDRVKYKYDDGGNPHADGVRDQESDQGWSMDFGASSNDLNFKVKTCD